MFNDLLENFIAFLAIVFFPIMAYGNIQEDFSTNNYEYSTNKFWPFDSQNEENSFLSTLKEAKGKDKGEHVHSISKINFIYTIARKKCRRYDDYQRQFERYGIYPYRFTSFSPSEITRETTKQTCLRGKRGYKDIIAQKMVKQKGEFILTRAKMVDYETGYLHHKMSLKGLSLALSNLSCIKDAIDSGYEYIWVMDTGTQLRCDPSVLSQFVENANTEIPNWTILYTDYGQRDQNDNINPLRYFCYRPDVNFFDPEYYLSRCNISGQQQEDEEYQEENTCHAFEYRPNSENDGSGATGPSGISYIEQNITKEINGTGFFKVGLLKGCHSYILNKKGMKLILEYYEDHKIFIPYSQEIQIIQGMEPYVVPYPVTKNTNK